MKIINQSADELVLKEGSASGIAFGVIFVIVGAGVGFYMYSPIRSSSGSRSRS